MKTMIRVGLWTNMEDEIHKAAVTKYGTFQWARISSLLVRRSAKQWKARWYDLIVPSISSTKAEWTREGDEKLLHLAKPTPAQWRTIAPVVGKTPTQCLGHYEVLLDTACAKDEDREPGDCDPRRQLWPGEIVPNPESWPPLPDPVDMDGVQKGMLSQALARLANNRGKKSKRKAREQQFEAARRLALLQKRRQLEAAGIEADMQRKRRGKGIDPDAEIPFEARPPPGFNDASGEERPTEQPKLPATVGELEGKRRRVDVEAQLRKQDAAQNRLQVARRQDAPPPSAAVPQVSMVSDPIRKRAKLTIPAPRISDRGWEDIATGVFKSRRKVLLAGGRDALFQQGEGMLSVQTILWHHGRG